MVLLLQQPSSSARSLGTKRSKNERDALPPPPSLPEEILIEIFARLPAKTVGRCRCMSRSWAATLSSDSFIDLHYQEANHNQKKQKHATGIPSNLFFTTAQRCLHAWRWRHNENDGPPPTLTGGSAHSLLPQLDRHHALRVLTAKPCHGLVLLHRWPWHGHYVCNPSTGALSPLPDTKMPSRMCCPYTLPNTILNCVSYGLGYDLATKEHKVVRLFYLNEGATAVTACEVFSIGGRHQACAHWRPAAHRAPSCTVRPSSPAVFFRGRLHFLQQEHGGRIITFDVHDETFGSFMPPPGLDDNNAMFELAVLDGCLCLHYGDAPTSTGDDVQGTSFYVWRLVSYDGAGHWEQLCCIRRQSWPEALLHLDRISPLEIYHGGDGHRKLMFSTCGLTVFAVHVDLDGGGAPEILLSPPTGDATVDSFIETNSGSHYMYNFIESNCGSHSTVGLLEESLVPVGCSSEETIFSSPSMKAWSHVLKWLPTRSVVPLRRVCKDWRAVIKSDRFMQLHAIHANMGKKCPKITLIDSLWGLFWTLGQGCGKELHPRNTTGYLFCPRLGARVVCSKSCHGLVVGSCTTIHQQASFDFVCNPDMGYYKQMRLDPEGDDTFVAGRIGLGYDSRMNRHVRVRLVYRERNMETRNYQLRCYIHLTDTEAAWRPIISSPPRPVAEMQPIFVNGKLYWMVDPNLGTKSSSGCEMLALDVSTEEFEVLQGPRCNYNEITSIVELNGNVCVVCSDRGSNALDIWTLEGGVWAIGWRVELREYSDVYSPEDTAPMAVNPTDQRLLLNTGRALGYYSPITKTVETIHHLVGQDVMKFAPVLTEESLICPYIRFEKATHSAGTCN